MSSELCEKSFLPRLATWNDAGNEDYRPKTYQDLADLPIILVVAEKGKFSKSSHFFSVNCFALCREDGDHLSKESPLLWSAIALLNDNSSHAECHGARLRKGVQIRQPGRSTSNNGHTTIKMFNTHCKKILKLCFKIAKWFICSNI